MINGLAAYQRPRSCYSQRMLWSPLEALFAGVIGLFSDAMSKDRRDDPVYKKNVQKLIERNRRFEESKE